MILINEEFDIMPKKQLCNKFKVTSNVYYSILKGEGYKDYVLDYQKITDTQKQELVSLLRNQQKKTL